MTRIPRISHIPKTLMTVLSVLVCLLLAAGVLKLARNYNENRQLEEKQAAGETTEDNVILPEYRSLTYHNGSTTLTFELGENNIWFWTADHAFPLDPSTVQAVLDKLAALDLTEAASDPEDLDDYGLSSPAYTITAQGEYASLTLAFGNQVEEGEDYYLLKDGDQSKVYTVSGDLLPLLDIPIYDMMVLPKLPDLSTLLVDYIRIRGQQLENGGFAAYTTLAAQWPDAAEGESLTMADVSWRSNGANVTDAPVVVELLEALNSLTLTKCMNYNPSPEALTLCGFDAPAARVDITYRTPTGIEEKLVLTIGNQLLDGSGRYVQVGEEDTSLYKLSSELLEPLMQIATQGLEQS